MATNSFNLLSDAVVVAPKSFNLLSDAVVVPPNSFALLSDALVLPASAFALLSDAVVGIPPFTGVFALTSDALIVEARAKGQGVRRTSQNASDCRTCFGLNCDDTALEDWYSLDGPVFGYQINCPPGFICDSDTIFMICCDRVLTVTIPPTATQQQRQEIIDSFIRECLRLQTSCADPCPNPPCDPPPIIPPPFPPPGGPTPPPIQYYFNEPTYCRVNCSTGGTFSYTVRAGMFVATTQLAANTAAFRYACQLAQSHKICLPAKTLNGCVGDAFNETIKATGALARFPETNFWSVIGSLPPGLTATEGISNDPFIAISGTPTMEGAFTFTVRVTVNPRGDTQEREYTITIKTCRTDFGTLIPSIVEWMPGGNEDTWSEGGVAFNLAAGVYKVEYVTGAWKSPGPVFLVGDGVIAAGKGRGYYIIHSGGTELAFPPSGLYASQAACEAANAGAFITFAHSGGQIGMHLWDSPYTDNTAGSPNPTFRLTKV